MKILYYNHTGKVSGAERVLFTMLAAGSQNANLNRLLLAPGSETISSFCRDHSVKHLPVPELQARFTVRPDKFLKYIASLIKLVQCARSAVQQESPDLIHANSTRAGIVMSLASLGLRASVIWHIHDILPPHPLSTVVRALAFSSKRTHILAISHATAKCFRGKLPAWLVKRTSMSVIHNGVDPSRFQPQQNENQPLLKSLGLTADHFGIGIVGQITPRKGHLGLIRAFAELVKSGLPNARLLIVGAPVFNNDAQYLELLKRETQRLGLAGRVLFLGSRHDIPALLQTFKVLVLNSDTEPFGLVLVEAMLSGVPVVATRVGGVPEIVENGQSGKLFHPGDETALVQTLRELADRPEERNRLAAAGRQRALRNFNSELFLQKLEHLYADLHRGSSTDALSSASRLQTEP